MDKVCGNCKYNHGFLEAEMIRKCLIRDFVWIAPDLSCPRYEPKPPEIPAALRNWKPAWNTGTLPDSARVYTGRRFLISITSGFYDVAWAGKNGDIIGAWTCSTIKPEDVIAWAELP